MSNKDNRAFVRGLAMLSQIGLTFVVCMGIGVFLGRVLDDWLGTSPWLFFVFSLLGIAAAFKAVYDIANSMK